jgi:hypothetical protein
MEAMSAGCLVVGSRTAPVEEVLRYRENGLLADFFDLDEIAATVVDAWPTLARIGQSAGNGASAVHRPANVSQITTPPIDPSSNDRPYPPQHRWSSAQELKRDLQ